MHKKFHEEIVTREKDCKAELLFRELATREFHLMRL